MHTFTPSGTTSSVAKTPAPDGPRSPACASANQNCFPSFTGRNRSGWRYLPFTIDGVPVLVVLSDEFDDSEDEEFYNAARRHRFDQLMLRRDAQIRFWRSAAPRDVRAEEPCNTAIEETPL